MRASAELCERASSDQKAIAPTPAVTNDADATLERIGPRPAPPDAARLKLIPLASTHKTSITGLVLMMAVDSESGPMVIAASPEKMAITIAICVSPTQPTAERERNTARTF